MSVLDRIPLCNTEDPADLEAWFGPFGWADHLRKIVLSNCAEAIRARAEGKVTEKQIDTLAHIEGAYVDFVIQCLNGRRLREQNVRDSITGGPRA